VLFDGDTRLLGFYTQIFMSSLAGFVARFFPIFLLGAIFGRLMRDSGAADTIARAITLRLGPQRALAAIVLACSVLTYGGVSVFVVAFAAYPIAAALLRAADIPKRLIPGALVLGAGTFTMTALPGTPSIQNAIPMPFFGTDLYAAPGLGAIAGVIMFTGGMLWLQWRERRAREAGEGYGHHPFDVPADTVHRGPGLAAAIAPILLVVSVNYAFTTWAIPRMDVSYLAEPRFGGIGLNDVRGSWGLIVALITAIAGTVVLNAGRWRNLKESVNEGTMSSLLPIFNTASEVGYGTVVASLAAFAVIRQAVVGISPDNPLISQAVAVTTMAGITGSASGGMSIALGVLGSTYLDMARAAGLDPAILHRVAAMASGGLDTLPHNGAIITMFAICRLTHRESYADVFVVSVLIPIVALATVIALVGVAGVF
jgi:H+/gluconate symporter-like permease